LKSSEASQNSSVKLLKENLTIDADVSAKAIPERKPDGTADAAFSAPRVVALPAKPNPGIIPASPKKAVPQKSFEERHYAPIELAEMWNFDPETIRNVFRNEPGVLKLRKGRNTTLRIPASVAIRVHERMSE
jgi:hypothetical protein